MTLSVKVYGHFLCTFQYPFSHLFRTFISHSQFYGYREPPHRYAGFDRELFYEKVAGGFAWWWILHHAFNNMHLVTGAFPYHDPHTEWSDEELGVPPDSEGLAPVIPNVRSADIPGASPSQDYYSPYYLNLHFGDIGQWKF